MTQVDIILARCKIGQTILDKLMTMKDKEIKDFLHKVVTSKNIHDIVWDGTVIRTIQNEIVQSIELCYYDRIEVCANGIKFIPEHRDSEFLILFDDNFITTSIKRELGIE
jgi:alpha-L-arabinofuranosidase